MKKVLLINLSKVILAVIVIVGITIFAIKIVDLSIIGSSLGITREDFPGTFQIIVNFFLGVVFVSLLTLGLTYLSQSKIQYIFYPDRVEMNKSFIVFSLKTDTIPYNNISSVRVEKEGINNMLNMGNIILELTGTERKTMVLENLGNADSYAPYIQKLLQDNQARYGAQYQSDKKIQDTLDQM